MKQSNEISSCFLMRLKRPRRLLILKTHFFMQHLGLQAMVQAWIQISLAELFGHPGFHDQTRHPLEMPPIDGHPWFA